MMCYKDIIFCRFYQNCRKGRYCHRSLTKEVEEGALRFGLSISQFTREPECYEKTFAEIRN